VRDLHLNNDHIHVVEQQMRQAIKLGLSREHHDQARL
jgi:hypothetical protein